MISVFTFVEVFKQLYPKELFLTIKRSMYKLNFKIMKLLNLLFILLSVVFLSSCNKEEDPTLVAYVNYVPQTTTGDVDGDFGGDGGSTSKSYTWQNSLQKADYNMDITASQGGKMQTIIKDAEGKVVLDHTLQGGATTDSKSGVTSSGAAGAWTVTITLTNFNGSGSFSMSQGN